MSEGNIVLSLLGIFVLTAAILTVIYAATYMTPKEFIVNVGGGTLFVLVSGWVLAKFPSGQGP